MGGCGIVDSKGRQSTDLDQQQELSVFAPIHHEIGPCISVHCQHKSVSVLHDLLTFQTAVAALADFSCLAAPAFALVAMFYIEDKQRVKAKTW